MFGSVVSHRIEAKLRNQSQGVGQLELYVKLFRETPRFTKAHGFPITAILLVPFEDKEVKALAEEKGFRYVVYAPGWITRYLISKKGGGRSWPST